MKKLAKASVSVLAVLLLVLAFTSCGGGKPAVADSIELWSFTDEVQKPAADFEAANPGKKVNVTITPTNEFVARIQPVLQAGTDAPDAFTGEAAFFRLFVESPFWENLSAKPYNAEQYVDKLADYMVALSRDGDGNLKALSWQVTPGAIIARRDIAIEVLGTDDPAEVSKHTSTWAAYWDFAKLIKEKTDGKKFIVSDVASSLTRIIFAGRKQPWIKDDKLNIPADLIKFFDDCKMARDAGYDAKYAQWSGEWSGSMETGEVFGYVLPTWGLHYVVKPNAPGQVGNYMLVVPPSSYYWGGTWLGIYSKAPVANKNLAWEFIKMMCTDDEYMTKYAKDTGDVLSNETVTAAIKDTFADEFLKGQNHYAYFLEEAKKIDGSTMSSYDQTVEQSIGNRLNEYLTDVITSVDGVVEAIKGDVKAAYPDVKVD
jgi:ABC-type glycerol-3-phosphate transport system substrate-binding protein